MKHIRPFRTVRPIALALVAVSLFAGCGGPRPLAVSVVGTPQLNSCSEGATANVAVVHVYYLTGTSNFQDATRESFWRDDKAALGDELVRSEQITLYPDQVQHLEIEPDESYQYIGVAADLRCPNEEQWRQVKSVEELRGKDVSIEVGADRVSLITQ